MSEKQVETFRMGIKVEEPEVKPVKNGRIKKRVIKWLGIETASNKRVMDEFRKDQDEVIRKLNAELDFWKDTFRKYSRIECAQCHKQMHVYPFGGAYYVRNGQKVHAACYDAYLETEAK